MQFDQLKRRDCITLLGGATTWPLVARAQQPAIPVIGYLNRGSPGPLAHLTAAFRQGLAELGYVEGRNVAIEYRWVRGPIRPIGCHGGGVVHRRVAVIAALPIPAAVAAKNATATIPIVFNVAGDPVKLGLVAGLARPGGNATGMNS